LLQPLAIKDIGLASTHILDFPSVD